MCGKCKDNADCAEAGKGTCLSDGKCAAACTASDVCPSGRTCVSPTLAGADLTKGQCEDKCDNTVKQGAAGACIDTTKACRTD